MLLWAAHSKESGQLTPMPAPIWSPRWRAAPFRMFKIKTLFVKCTLIRTNSKLNDNYSLLKGLGILVIFTSLISTILFHSHLLPARNCVGSCPCESPTIHHWPAHSRCPTMNPWIDTKLFLSWGAHCLIQWQWAVHIYWMIGVPATVLSVHSFIHSILMTTL